MDEVEDNSVQLIITSPPYWNAIDYKISVNTKNDNYRTRKITQSYEDYLKWLQEVFMECHRVLAPGRFCCVVIGTLLNEKKHYPLPFDFLISMQAKGWLFHQDIIWHKCAGGVKRAGSYIKNPRVGNFYPNIMTEYILIFRKAGNKFTSKERGILTDDLFNKEIANNVWHISPVPPNTGNIHPCPYPTEIARRLTLLYSVENDIVLDPFLGSGTTTKVAYDLNRNSIGYDIENSYISYSKKRIYAPKCKVIELLAIFTNLSSSKSKKLI